MPLCKIAPSHFHLYQPAKAILFFIGEKYSCPKQDEHKQAFTGSQRKMLSYSCRGKMHCLAVIYSVVTDILYSSTTRFGFRTQAYVESCPGFLRFLSRDIIFYLNHKLDWGKHKSCAFFLLLISISLWLTHAPKESEQGPSNSSAMCILVCLDPI